MTSPAAGRPEGEASPTLASFEEAVGRLTQIVERLEEGDLTLEESLALFEEGVNLSRKAQERLDRAQKRVEKLLRVDDQGRTKTEPFETTGKDDDEDPLL
jgi:exodeoxyribonuclease VII small subunit